MTDNAFTKAGYKTTKERSKAMAAIRSNNTKPEFTVRRLLFKSGYGYRLHYKKLPGSPDIVLTKYKVAIFINGCFWHHHGCHISHIPKSNSTFWLNKIKRNLTRDKKNVTALLGMGWRVLIIWECALSTKSQLPANILLSRVTWFLSSNEPTSAIIGLPLNIPVPCPSYI